MQAKLLNTTELSLLPCLCNRVTTSFIRWLWGLHCAQRQMKSVTSQESASSSVLVLFPNQLWKAEIIFTCLSFKSRRPLVCLLWLKDLIIRKKRWRWQQELQDPQWGWEESVLEGNPDPGRTSWLDLASESRKVRKEDPRCPWALSWGSELLGIVFSKSLTLQQDKACPCRPCQQVRQTLLFNEGECLDGIAGKDFGKQEVASVISETHLASLMQLPLWKPVF